jgi:hypothetical protein
MIAEFNNNWEEDDKIKTAATIQSVIDKRNAAHETLEECQDGTRQEDGCRHCGGRRQGQMEMTTMRWARLRRASLIKSNTLTASVKLGGMPTVTKATPCPQGLHKPHVPC